MSVISGSFNVKWRTELTRARIESMDELVQKIKADTVKKTRLAEQMCVYCFYRSAIAGQAFTEYTCTLCGKRDMHHNTNTPDLCMACAKSNSLCVHCGADIELKERKSL